MPPTVKRDKALKHLADRLAALAGLPLAVPSFLAVTAAIKVEDLLTGEGWAASPFFREPRYSANEEFSVCKFRILRPSVLAEHRRQGGTKVKGLEHQPGAATRVGKFLVRYYLDELPQFFHVLTGRMSLVGPRPVWPDDHRRREAFAPYEIKAGLAGTFQLAKGEGDIYDLDLIYLREYAERDQLGLLAYDLQVVLKTLRKMLKGEGL